MLFSCLVGLLVKKVFKRRGFSIIEEEIARFVQSNGLKLPNQSLSMTLISATTLLSLPASPFKTGRFII